MREERLFAVWTRLEQIRSTGVYSLALEPRAFAEAWQLAEHLHDNEDLQVLHALGWLHWYRYLARPGGTDLTDLATAIEALTPSFIANAVDLPERLLPLLADAAEPYACDWLEQIEGSSDPDLHSSVVDLWHRIARVAPTDHPNRAAYLYNLGLAHSLRARLVGVEARSDSDEAVKCLRQAVQATPTDHSSRAMRLVLLGNVLQNRFAHTGSAADVTEAVDCLRQAVQAAPIDHPDRVRMLSGLSGALQIQFERVGDRSSIDEAIAIGRDAVQATPTENPDRAMYLCNLGSALNTRFGWTEDREDSDEAVECLREAAQATPAGNPDQANLLSGLGAGLWVRFTCTGIPSDLDEAVKACREAVRAAPAVHPGRATFLSNLGMALQERFERTGVRADSDEAVDCLQAAVQGTPANHAQRAMLLSNLGLALRERYKRTGFRPDSDLDEAIAISRAAVQATPSGHPHRARYLSNLGIALQERFERTWVRPDSTLQEVVAGPVVLVAPPRGHPYRAQYLSDLAARRSRAHFRQMGGADSDLDEAIAVSRAAVQATPPGHPHRARYLSNLGTALQVRFEHTGGSDSDLDGAIAVGREAMEVTPLDHPSRATRASNLGRALEIRLGRTRRRVDLDEAVSAYTQAWRVASAAPSVRARAAWMVAALVAEPNGQPTRRAPFPDITRIRMRESPAARASDAAEAAVRLLPEMVPRQLERGDQQHVLGGFAGLAADAAALSLSDPRGTSRKRASRALRLLEAGRAVLLSQRLDVRSDLSDLQQQHPDLAARFIGLRDQFDQPVDDPIVAGMPTEGRAFASQVQDRHKLARDFAALLAEIRSLDGFASFALPPTTEELLAEAEHGPVVVFNISTYRSDALLLTRDGITHQELPELTPDDLARAVTGFQRALDTATSGADKVRRRKAQAVMVRTLQWLWDVATDPVLKALGYHGQPPAEAHWPRVWWVPGGLLGILPLHAAGYHTDPADDPHRRTVMDRVVSSYTPTVRALHYARQRTSPQDPPKQGLVVAMPTTPGLPGHGQLNHVRAEAEVLRRHLPRAVVLSEPEPAEHPATPSPETPTKTTVLRHLPASPIAHFACHGTSHPTDPSRSHLLLHDHSSDPLTVASLTPVRLERAQLAYLSACRTAAIDTTELLDEAIHLTSAFQLAGFPHVIGTLWEVDDQIAVGIADAFYTHLRTEDGAIDTRRAAWALHQTVRGVRDGHDLPGNLNRTQVPFLWAAYLHVGA